MSLEPGYVIGGRYRIDLAVGGGGFGTVYRATQLNLGRAVAIKVLHATLMMTDAALSRFRREAQLAQQLRHPNTVRVFDFGQTEHGFPYIVWEYLEGLPINQLLARQGPMPAQRVAHIGAQVLKALMEAHSLGIVHRDIKPANVIVGDFAGEPDFVKVLDFGVAKALGESNMTVTDGTTPLGTPSYMAPEQVQSQPVSPATDLYSLGLMMAEMLTGHAVFQGRSVMDVFMAQASQAPAPIPAMVLEGPLGAVIGRATQKPPGHRFATAAEMLAAIERAPSSTTPHAAGAWGRVSYDASVVAPPTPVSPYQPAASIAPTLTGTSGGVLSVTAAPTSSGGGSMIALAIFGGLVAIGVIGAMAAGGIYWASRETPAPVAATSVPAATATAVTAPPSLPAADETPVELGARSGKGFDGIGATTALAKIEGTGWKRTGIPVKNIEGTYTSNIIRIEKSATVGKIVMFRFDDAEECKAHASLLSKQPDSAVARESAAIIQVQIPNDAAEAKKLLGLITR